MTLVARERGVPRLSDAVATTGALAAALGVLLLAIDIYADEPDRPPAVALFVALALAGYLVLSLLPVVLHPAGVTAVAVGVPGALAWWLLPGAQRFADVRPFLLLTIVALTLCWLAPRTRGRPVFVGLVLALVWLWVLGEIAGNSAYSAAPLPSPPPQSVFSVASFAGRAAVTLDELDPTDPLYPLAERCAAGETPSCDALYFAAPPESEFRDFGATCGGSPVSSPGSCAFNEFGPEDGFGFDEPGFDEPRFGIEQDDKSLEIGVVSLLFGLAYLAALIMLDRRAAFGLATAFVVPGALALFTGTSQLGSAADSPWFGGLLTFLAGIVFGASGHVGRRRFTTWFGGFMATAGAVTIALDASDVAGAIDDDVRLAGPGLGVLAAGVALVALAYLIAAVIARLGFDPGAPPSSGAAPQEPPGGPGGPREWPAAPGPPPWAPPSGPPPATPPAWPPPEAPPTSAAP